MPSTYRLTQQQVNSLIRQQSIARDMLLALEAIGRDGRDQAAWARAKKAIARAKAAGLKAEGRNLLRSEYRRPSKAKE